LKPSVWVASITFSDDTIINFEKNDVVILVGPNNSGKSATLKAIFQKAESPAASSAVVRKVSLKREGSAEDLIAWLTDTTRENTSNPGFPSFQKFDRGVHRDGAGVIWRNGSDNVSQLAPFFLNFLTTESRLQAANPQGNIPLTREAPRHPIHVLQRDDSVERRLNEQFRKAFGLDMVLHRNAGSLIPILVGDKPAPGPEQDRLSVEYARELEKLPSIETQGDGMRSFLGILLFSMVGHETVLLIDEPEAFLHPPQARHLGNVLVSDTEPDRQIFIATHSGDVLRGVLDSESARVKVLRLRREGQVNITRELKNEQINQVWSDPLLRYSNILDGLFHERVILCEADSDCRFYSAIVDSLFESGSGSERKPDVMFTHCGGKARMPLVIRSLRDLEVPLSVVTDFDILNDEHPLHEIVEAMGGNWDIFAADWREVKNAVDSKKPELNADEVKKNIEDVLAKTSGAFFSQSARKQIQTILKRSSPWATAKTVGVSFVPGGQPSQARARLLDNLEALGVFVVPVGEVEGFVRTVGDHGPGWVAEVLKKDFANDIELQPAKDFVRKFI
jgi:ABC-type ATPase involved in cell division